MRKKYISVKNFRISEVKKAIQGSLGIMSTIAANLNVDWHTAQKLINMWDETKQAYQDECERTGDLVESNLLKRIKDGDTIANIFYAKTKLKHRGYTERQEIQHNLDGISITVVEAKKKANT